MSEPFYRHLFPAQYLVLGRVLPALSLWHLAALEAVASPFVGASESASIELGDLQVACKIVRTQWPHQPDLKPGLRDWWQQVRHRRDKRFLHCHASAFAAYLSAHRAPPEMWKAQSGTREITAPPILSLVTGLADFPALSLFTIWNDMTPGFALWWLNAHAERESPDVKFVRDDDPNPDDLPDLTHATEEEQEEIVRRELGEEAVTAWKKLRKEAQR